MTLFKPDNSRQTTASEKRHRGSFSSPTTCSSFFKYLNIFGSDNAVSEMVRLLGKELLPLELDFINGQFFRQERFSQHGLQFYLEMIRLHKDKVRWEDVLSGSLYNDHFFRFIHQEKKLEAFVQAIVAGSGRDPLNELIIRMGFARKGEVFCLESAQALELGLCRAFEAVLASDYLERGLVSLNTLLSVHQLVQARGLATPAMAAQMVLKVSQSKQPNLELLLGLLKEVLAARPAAQLSPRPAKPRELFLQKVPSADQVKHELEAAGLSVEENRAARHGVAPLYSPEIDTYFFLTNLEHSSADKAEHSLAKQAVTSVFETLVGDKPVVIFDVWDLENPQSELDLPALIREMKQRVVPAQISEQLN